MQSTAIMGDSLCGRFLDLLVADLRSAGLTAGDGPTLNRPLEIIPPSESSQRLHMRYLRDKQILAAQNFILRKEKEGSLDLLPDGTSIIPKRVYPEIRFCMSRSDHELFNYLRMFQRIPTTNRVGRQIRAIVYDVGQKRPTAMGIISLASGTYTLKCRDDYLWWQGRNRKSVKDAGLRSVFDLAVVLALPPYNLLRCGKLIASLALTAPFRQEIARRYGSTLLGLVATSGNGLHCPILNRIGLRAGGLYRRIGATAGYTNVFASPATLKAARALLPHFVSSRNGEFSVSVRPFRVLRDALQVCGIPADAVLRTGIPKGVYFGTTDAEHVIALRNGRLPHIATHLSLDEAECYWRERVLPKALQERRRVNAFLAYRRQSPLSSIDKLAA